MTSDAKSAREPGGEGVRRNDQAELRWREAEFRLSCGPSGITTMKSTMLVNCTAARTSRIRRSRPREKVGFGCVNPVAVFDAELTRCPPAAAEVSGLAGPAGFCQTGTRENTGGMP